jgi:23S rRNA (uracil1939-C5)-methyltransferase
VPAVQRNQELELDVDSLAYGGRGVARHGELVVFVSRSLPGDRVRARVTKVKRRYAEAKAVEVLQKGPGRVEPRCPHFGVCGGCAWQDLDYEEQLRHKTAQVDDALRRLGHLDGYTLEPTVPAVELYGYRNKLEYSWSNGPDGPSLGFHVAGRWDTLLAVDVCHIASEPGNCVRRAFERWARDSALTVRTGEGFLRHLVVREGRRTGQLLAQLVTAPGDVPAVERLRELVPPETVGAVRSVNDGVAEVTAGLPTETLFGAAEFEEEILGVRLRLTAGAFMQTNTEMCDRLYQTALEFADLRGDETVWDLYCGAGAIALVAARAAGRVVGVELSEESVARARENAALNAIANVEFVAGDVAREARPLRDRLGPPDVVVVDPPRAGLTPKAVRRVVELAPERIVYVSCNPTTLAPNARQLVDAGYRLERVRPVDMFPHTAHIECVARFTRAG